MRKTNALKKHILIICSTCLFGASVVFAQTYNFKNYTVKDGLEQADVLSLFQATNGYLLYGTNGGGLGFYDGYSFQAVKIKDGLANNVVFSISEYENNIWCATNSGISKLSSIDFKVEKNYNINQPFYCSFYNQNNTIYFGSSDGLYIYDIESDSITKQSFNNKLLSTASVTSIFSDSLHNLLIGTKEHGLFVVNTNTNIVKQYNSTNSLLTNNYITSIKRISNESYFIGTLKGIAILERDTISIINIGETANSFLTITDFAIHNNNVIASALNGHLYFIDIKTKKIKFLNKKNGFIYDKSWKLLTDKENNLWIATLGNGLLRYISNFRYIDEYSTDLVGNNIKSVTFINNKLFVATKKAINLLEYENVTDTFSIKSGTFSEIFEIFTIQNQVFLSTNKGILRYNNKIIDRIHYKENINLNDLEAYTHLSTNGKIFIGGKSGVYELKNDSLLQLPNTPKVSVYNIISFKNTIYLASENGIYKLNASGFEFIGSAKGINCTRARTFIVDNDNLWIGTDNGIYLFDGDKAVLRISEKNHLTSDNIYFIIDDKEGNIWAGTNKSVEKINKKSVYDYLNDSTNHAIKISTYNKNKGFNGMECNMNAVTLHKNQLYFGTINGLYIYNKNNDKENNIPPQLTLKNIKLHFKDINWKTDFNATIDTLTNLPSNLALNYKNNNLIFEYVGISLTNPDEVVYQYKLEGLDNDWLPITSDRKAVYTAIPPGNYTFLLKAKNADGFWTETPVSFSFTITPPWWKTTVFYFLSVLIVLSAFYFIMDYRTKKLKKEQLLLTLKVEERTRELRNEKEKVESINTQLEEKNGIIEIANKNITDSINYAKKIQEAILPKPTKIDELAENVSILFIPKDVVSGDFYWFERVEHQLIIAAADCTGHGVPGAFMSMLGINNLNQIVLENKITSPDKILFELNNSIKKTLKQDDFDSESKDGMDISLVCFDNKTNKISFSGAFRPLIYVRDNKLTEIKASRQPIGGNAPLNFNYELTTLEFKKGDAFYLFSDGYPDQFGGEKNKKLMNKKLKDIFLSIHNETPAKQKDMLTDTFFKWKGNYEQIDDILVICIKI